MAVALSALTACATPEEMDARFAKLEDKVNQALQASAAAKIDATTALDVALQNKK